MADAPQFYTRPLTIRDIYEIVHPNSLEPRITQSVRELGDLLIGIKGGGNLTNTNQAAQRNAVAVEADEVLRPLMDLLDGSLTLYAQSCEKTVLKRLLKELWKIVMRILEKTIVLPPMTDRTVRFSATFLPSVFGFTKIETPKKKIYLTNKGAGERARTILTKLALDCYGLCDTFCGSNLRVHWKLWFPCSILPICQVRHFFCEFLLKVCRNVNILSSIR